jgi:hypothetical protein
VLGLFDQTKIVFQYRKCHFGGQQHLRSKQVFRAFSAIPNSKGKCAIITSYNPSHRDVVTEDTGANTETEKQYIYNTYVKLLSGQQTEKYEEEAKTKFRKEPVKHEAC